MRTALAAWTFLAGLFAAAQDREQLKTVLKDADVPASWVYDDVDAGFAEARKSGKPMLVVFR
jgi:hypothetical protein